MEAKKHKFRDTDMQGVVGWVLRIGVIASMAIVIFGGIIYLWRHDAETENYTKFTPMPNFIQLNGLMKGILDFHGRSIIQAGIVLLIATPIMRIICSTISFALEKDKLYVTISLLVLFIIFISTISGHID